MPNNTVTKHIEGILESYKTSPPDILKIPISEELFNYICNHPTSRGRVTDFRDGALTITTYTTVRFIKEDK